jgi:pimeloyl-ACP methyl ester carboxylesterase
MTASGSTGSEREAPARVVEHSYVRVNDLDVYFERHGHGSPLVLLHGALGTIDSCFAGLVPLLARHFSVIALELQGHGHTRDTDRPLTYEGMAADVAAALGAFGIKRADIVGYSMGGAVAIELALDRPDLVDHVVYAGGASFDPSGVHPELTAAFESFDPHELDGTRWHRAYVRVAPDPDAWTTLVRKNNELDRSGLSWPRERLATLSVPSLLIIGDADVVTPEHTVEMFRLLGGGVPGDLVDLPRAQLAVLPGTTHVGMLDRVDWLSSMIITFLKEQSRTG